MAENIRLKFSVDDLASAELKRIANALNRLEGPVSDLSFKWQYNFLRMQEAMQKFNSSPFATKVKSLATSVKDAVARMKSAWESWLDKTEKSRARFSKAVDGMKGMLRSLKNNLTGLPAMIAGGVMAGAFGMAIKQGLAFNATLETLKVQFQVMTGDAKRASDIMKGLVQFAAKTPFQLEEVAGAARIMMAYQIQGSENLRRIGDAAAAANRPLDEVAMTFGRIKSGAFGEAFMRLAEMGIATRKMLEGEGLVFDKSGSYQGSADAALAAVTRIVDRRFRGMMDKLSQTMAGKMSTLKDDIAMTLGLVTGKLFDNMKPRLDRLSKAFARMRDSGVAAGVGGMLANAVTPVVDKLISLIENPEKAFGFFLKMADYATVIWLTMKNGVMWFWNVATAFFTWLMAKIDTAGLAMKDMIPKMLGGGLSDAERKRLDAGNAKVDAASLRLGAAASAPGARAFWQEGIRLIRETDYEQRARERYGAGASTTSAMMQGKGGGGDAMRSYLSNLSGIGRPQMLPSGAMMDLIAGSAGLSRESFGVAGLHDTSREHFARAGGFAGGPAALRPVASTLAAGLAAGGASADPNVALAAVNDRFRKDQKDLWRNYYLDLGDMAQTLFVDTMSTIILSKHEDLKAALNDIWQGMKANFVHMTVGMASDWAKLQFKKLAAEQFFAKTKMAVDTASTVASAGNTAARVAGNTTEAASNLAVAKTGFFKAHSWIPWVGAGIALAMIALMMKSVGTFRTGGVVGGGGSGNEDDRFARLSGGEGILTKAAVDRNGGRSFVDSLNSGRVMGGGSNLALTFNVTGGGTLLAADIEREVVPVLERLVRQRKAVLA